MAFLQINVHYRDKIGRTKSAIFAKTFYPIPCGALAVGSSFEINLKLMFGEDIFVNL